MNTIILVGGLGTRLRDIVKDVPKPMANINGKPFLEYLMDNMLKYGTKQFILCVGHQREVIMNYFKNSYKGVCIKYSIEKELLGTGGAIKQAFDLFDIDNAVVLNGDTFVKMDYADFYKKMSGEKLGLSLKYVQDASRYGLIKTEGSRVIGFTEKKDSEEAGFINAGIYVVSRSLFRLAEGRKKFSFEKDILEKCVSDLRPKFYQAEDYFIDIGIPESYKQACTELESEIYSVK